MRIHFDDFLKHQLACFQRAAVQLDVITHLFIGLHVYNLGLFMNNVKIYI